MRILLYALYGFFVISPNAAVLADDTSPLQENELARLDRHEVEIYSKIKETVVPNEGKLLEILKDFRTYYILNFPSNMENFYREKIRLSASEFQDLEFALWSALHQESFRLAIEALGKKHKDFFDAFKSAFRPQYKIFTYAFDDFFTIFFLRPKNVIALHGELKEDHSEHLIDSKTFSDMMNGFRRISAKNILNNCPGAFSGMERKSLKGTSSMKASYVKRYSKGPVHSK